MCIIHAESHVLIQSLQCHLTAIDNAVRAITSTSTLRVCFTNLQPIVNSRQWETLLILFLCLFSLCPIHSLILSSPPQPFTPPPRLHLRDSILVSCRCNLAAELIQFAPKDRRSNRACPENQIGKKGTLAQFPLSRQSCTFLGHIPIPSGPILPHRSPSDHPQIPHRYPKVVLTMLVKFIGPNGDSLRRDCARWL